MSRPVRIGTRASLLATTQSELVAALIRDRLGRETELVEVTTEGDRTQAEGTPLEQAGGTGVFVGALRDALLAGEVDVAVHSLKDLPTATPEGIALAAVPLREDPRDVVVARDGSPSCSPSASVWTWSAFVATSTPGSRRSAPGSTTQCSLRPDRARWRWSAGPTTTS